MKRKYYIQSSLESYEGLKDFVQELGQEQIVFFDEEIDVSDLEPSTIVVEDGRSYLPALGLATYEIKYPKKYTHFSDFKSIPRYYRIIKFLKILVWLVAFGCTIALGFDSSFLLLVIALWLDGISIYLVSKPMDLNVGIILLLGLVLIVYFCS